MAEKTWNEMTFREQLSTRTQQSRTATEHEVDLVFDVISNMLWEVADEGRSSTWIDVGDVEDECDEIADARQRDGSENFVRIRGAAFEDALISAIQRLKVSGLDVSEHQNQYRISWED